MHLQIVCILTTLVIYTRLEMVVKGDFKKKIKYNMQKR